MTVVCSKCGEEIVSPVVGAINLAPVLVELASHCNLKHNKEYREYGSNLAVLMQILPAYYMIECFVDVDKTNILDSVTASMITQSQKIVTDTLGLDVNEEVKPAVEVTG